VKENRYQFTCKLCDFDSALEVGKPLIRTPDGDLKFSSEWVCPEIFLAYDEELRSSVRKIDNDSLRASLQMDISILD